MKLLLISGAIVAAVSLSGCAALLNAAAGGPLAQATSTVHIAADKAFTLAYDALDFVEIGLIEPAVQDGQIKGLNAQRLAGLIRQARGILDGAFNAYKSGLAGDPSKAISSVYDLISQIKTVLNGAGVATPAIGPAAYVHHSVGDVHQDTARLLLELEGASWRSTSIQS